MLIECILRRSNGTTIILGENEYHFSPNPKGQHVCDITNKKHVETLLAIPEAYCIAGDKLGVVPKVVEQKKQKKLNPEAMTNKELERWATERGILPKSKNSIAEFGRSHYELNVNQKYSIYNMIRSLVHAASQEAGENDSS